MADLHAVDKLWFDMHPEETHRIRPSTDAENAAVPLATAYARDRGHTKNLTILRRSDGMRAVVAVSEASTIDRLTGPALTEWFDNGLTQVATDGETPH